MIKRTITLERALFLISTINTRVVDPGSVRIGIAGRGAVMKLGSIEYMVTDDSKSTAEIASAIESTIVSEIESGSSAKR